MSKEDPLAAVKQFLATQPGSLGLKQALDEAEAETKRIIEERDRAEQKAQTILAEKQIVEGKTGKALRGTATELHISRSDSHDPQKYQAMKALAARQGRTLRVVDDAAAPPSANDGPPAASRVKYIEDRESGTLYVNVAVRDKPGVGPLGIRNIAAHYGLQRAEPFRSARDLPAHLQQAHQQALVDGEGLIDGDRERLRKPAAAVSRTLSVRCGILRLL